MTAYPHAPGARAVDTSQAAALAIGPVTAPLQQKVLDALDEHGDLATFEIAARSGVSYRSLQPRTSELRRLGRIKDSGQRKTDPETGRDAIVWTLG
tara:strand:+ start:441 stop:728 length:288 start_codon:yes stop_codon:yes gene_type:complete